MSPVQFSDVTTALKICDWIKTHCFEPLNNASLLYLGFKRDVLHLQGLLDEFQISSRGAVDRVARDHDQAVALGQEIDLITNDFVSTLENCQTLLKKHARFENNHATALDNGFWHTNTQPVVTKLTDRLRDHHYKLELFSRCTELDLLSAIFDDTREILAHRTTLALPAIPEAINQAFESATLRDCPVTLDNVRGIPLQHAIDALSRHYRESSIGSDRSPQADLSLLKAHWLHRIITASTSLQDSRAGSLARRVVDRIGRDLEVLYQQRQVLVWPEDIFSDLNQTEFAIWPLRTFPKPPILTNPAPQEERLACEEIQCPYPGQKQELFVFRVNENLLRVLDSRGPIDLSSGSQMTNHFVNLDNDSFIPMYAIAQDHDRTKGSISFTCAGGASVINHSFRNRRSILRFQQAFTGYEVVHCPRNVQCSITYKNPSMFSIRHEREGGIGEVQLWQIPRSSGAIITSSSPRTRSSDERSDTTGSGQTLASLTFESFDSGVVSVSATEDGCQTVIGRLPKPPLLVMILKSKDTYSMYQLDISCLHPSNVRKISSVSGTDLYQLTIERSEKESFEVRKINASGEQLNMWDLRALQRPDLSKKKPKHKSAPFLEKLKATGVNLDFASEEACNTFVRCFKLVRLDRMKQHDQLRKGSQVAGSQAQLPTTREFYATSRRGSSLVPASESTTTGAIAPSLDPIPDVASFNIGTA